MADSKYSYFPADIVNFSYLMWDIDKDTHFDLMAFQDKFSTQRVPVIVIEADKETGHVVSSFIDTEYYNLMVRACVPARHCCGTRMHLHYNDKTETLVHRCPTCGQEEVEHKYEEAEGK